MSTTAQLSENSHQGFDGIKAALCLGSTWVKSNTASEMPVCLRRNGIGSRSSGKERDVETGLDYFLARYYSGAQGRFLSPDEFKGGPDDALTGADVTPPGPLPYADISNPQSLNKYAYTYNNPLRYTDPDGHLVDTIADIGFIGYDIYTLFKEGSTATNWIALGADVAGAFVPFATGGGAAVRAARAADKMIDGAKTLNKLDNAADAVKLTDKATDVKKASNVIESGSNPSKIIVDPKGNAIPLKSGETVTSSPDGKWIQVRDAQGKPTGTRLDGAHKPTTHPDPRAQKPHAHVPGKTNPDGTPWLPVNN